MRIDRRRKTLVYTLSLKPRIIRQARTTQRNIKDKDDERIDIIRDEKEN
mgnify:CR=1 FL=1|jgi:hypothetical protein